jgi:hypothetical protein
MNTSVNYLIPFCNVGDDNCENTYFLTRLFLNNAGNFIKINDNLYIIKIKNNYIKKFIFNNKIYLVASDNTLPVLSEDDKMLDVKQFKLYPIMDIQFKSRAKIDSADNFKFQIKYFKYKMKYLNLLNKK